MYSPADGCQDGPDRKAHGDLPMLEYDFLSCHSFQFSSLFLSRVFHQFIIPHRHPLLLSFSHNLTIGGTFNNLDFTNKSTAFSLLMVLLYGFLYIYIFYFKYFYIFFVVFSLF
jgi:hypothetical protein